MWASPGRFWGFQDHNRKVAVACVCLILQNNFYCLKMWKKLMLEGEGEQWREKLIFFFFFFVHWWLFHPCLAAEAMMNTCHVFQLISGSFLPWLLEMTKQYLIWFYRYAKQGCCSPWSRAGHTSQLCWAAPSPRVWPTGAQGSRWRLGKLEGKQLCWNPQAHPLGGGGRDWGMSGS